MGIKAQVSERGPRELPPPGSHLAICNGVYMLGTQPGFRPGSPPRMQIMLSFELHKRKGPLRDSEGRVMETSVIMDHTVYLKGPLIRYAGALRGKPYTEDEIEAMKSKGGFDPEILLGLSCRLAIEHEKKLDGNLKDKIKSVSMLDPDDDTPPKPETDEVYWDWTLGDECPKRIAYFWDRAAENPKQGSKSTFASIPTGQFADVDTEDDNAPF